MLLLGRPLYGEELIDVLCNQLAPVVDCTRTSIRSICLGASEVSLAPSITVAPVPRVVLPLTTTRTGGSPIMFGLPGMRMLLTSVRLTHRGVGRLVLLAFAISRSLRTLLKALALFSTFCSRLLLFFDVFGGLVSLGWLAYSRNEICHSNGT